MTDTTVQVDVLNNETAAEPVAETVKEAPELPEGEKQQDVTQEQKPEPTEAEKIKHAMQKRIDKQTARMSEMERKLAEAEATLLKFQKPNNDGMPKEEDYPIEEGGYEAFLKDLGKWEARQELKAENETKAKAERDAAYQRTIDQRREMFIEKETELKAVTPDYDEKVGEVEQTIALLSDQQKASTEFSVFRDMLFSSDNMPALAYELGKNPDLLERMLTMNPMQIARQIARLELQIENAPKKQHEPVAAPPSPISGSSKTSSKPIEEMNYKEIKKAWGI